LHGQLVLGARKGGGGGGRKGEIREKEREREREREEKEERRGNDKKKKVSLDVCPGEDMKLVSAKFSALIADWG
jgi:hypothetical protein